MGISENTLCSSCRGLCCGPNIVMSLTRKNHDMMIKTGTKLKKLLPFSPTETNVRIGFKFLILGKGLGLFRRETWCGLLILRNDQSEFPLCSVHNSSNQPDDCCGFIPGDETCMKLRKSAGIS